jgi:hypothetical protein
MDYGMVVPSFLKKDIGRSSPRSGFIANLQEFALRLGNVVATYPPSDKRNLSKKYNEYDVLVYVYNGNGNVTPKTFYNCVVSDMFSSVADRVSYTPRKTTAASPQGYALSKGSLVAVMCANGDTTQGIIIGGYPNNNLPTVSEDLGHHLSFEFNGVQFNIDKDGQVTIKRRGPTNDDGTVVSDQEANGGATVLMTSDGSVSVQSGNGNHVKVDLDATNGSLNLSCTEGVIINSATSPMVLGDKLVDAVSSLVNGIVSGLNAIVPGGPGSAAVPLVQQALLQFQSDTSFLSAKNKVD